MNQTVSTQPETLSRPIKECLAYIFPTPLALHQWPDSDALNAELAAVVKEAEAAAEPASPHKAKSNVGGWHSDVRFIHRDEPCLARLRARITTLADEFTGAMVADPTRFDVTIEGWANVLRDGSYNSLHMHPGCTWSGVYYVTDAGLPPDPQNPSPEDILGTIEFLDPRPGAVASVMPENRMERRSVFNPPAGAMIMFPSWLQHMVHPYRGDGERISVAFNVKLQSKA
ncbi:MAG: TIGR02466 family protein [Pseudomonadota bacterium]